MERSGHPPTPMPAGSEPGPLGALVVHNGRLAGTSRPLGFPLTLLGRAAGCDVRLNVDAVEPFHCLLIFNAAGLIVRDLETGRGTHVNGEPVQTRVLSDGDILAVGPFQFRVVLPVDRPAFSPSSELESLAAQKEALRIQAAAVAAQQAALDECEVQLQQRRETLEQQETQLAAHLEEKRQRLVQAGEKLHAERAALHAERTAHEKHVEKLNRDLGQGQRELLEKQQQVQAERSRLADLYRRLSKRWRRERQAERERLRLREEELANEACNLENEAARLSRLEQALTQERLRFNGQYELGRRQLRDAWNRLRTAQGAWRRRRAQERSALKLRALELEATEARVTEAERVLQHEQTQWQLRCRVLEQEAAGLDNRVRSLRKQLSEQQTLAAPDVPSASGDSSAPVLSGQEETPRDAFETPSLHTRLVDLDRLAAGLADQRAQLVEQWQRLVRVQRHWEEDRIRSASELEHLAERVLKQERAVEAREQAVQTTEASVRQRQEELGRLRQQLLAWRARLQVRDTAWESERRQLLAEIRHGKELADSRLHALDSLRDKWGHRLREEVTRLQTERAACEKLRHDYATLRADWLRRGMRLEQEKRVLAEKMLALEQLRVDFLAQTENAAAAERKIERLRRRWLTQNTVTLRLVKQERRGLEADLARLQHSSVELHQQAEAVSARETDLAARLTAWEHEQARDAARNTDLQKELDSLRTSRHLTEEALARSRDEIEQIARILLDEPEPPILPFERAA